MKLISKLLFYFSLILTPGIYFYYFNYFSLENLPISFGLIFQLIVGISIGIYNNSKESNYSSLKSLGFSLFFLGISSSYLCGKTIWMPFFWELSSLGGMIIFFEGDRLRKNTNLSIVLLFLSSGAASVFLMGWVFLENGNFYGKLFLLLGLLLKSSFSIFHIWYPDFHKGSTPSLSAALSSVASVMPTLLFMKFLLPEINHSVVFKILIPIAGVGIFLGGFTSFFSKDIRKILAFSSIETINFLWLLLFLIGYWKLEIVRENGNIDIQTGFLILFFLTLAHHSISKCFQFLSFGSIPEITGSGDINFNKGFLRKLQIPILLIGLGTFSYILIPGTLGFLSESTYFFLLSKVIDIPGKKTLIIVPALIFILFGQTLGSMGHLRIYLSLGFSISSLEDIDFKEEFVNRLKNSLQFLGFFIFVLPILFLVLFLFSGIVNENILSQYKKWFKDILIISSVSVIFYIIITKLIKPHKITGVKGWDCGNNYDGPELSIPGSVISDPLHESLGTLIDKENGNSKIDIWIKGKIQKGINLGEIWISGTESGELSDYIAFSSISLLIVFFIIFVLRYYKGVPWIF